MPNNKKHNFWNSFLPYAFGAGANVGNAFLEKDYNDDTDRLYKKTLESLDGLISQYKNPITPENAPEPNTPPERTGIPGTGRASIEPIMLNDKNLPSANGTKQGFQVTNQTDNNIALQDLYKQHMMFQDKLGSRGEYGQDKAKNLANYLAMSLTDDKDYVYTEFGDEFLRTNKRTGETTVLRTKAPKEDKANVDTNFAPDVVYEEGGKYYAENYTFDKTSGEDKTITREISPKAYKYFNDKQTKTSTWKPTMPRVGRIGGLGKDVASPDEIEINNLANDLADLQIKSQFITGDDENAQKLRDQVNMDIQVKQEKLRRMGIDNPEDIATRSAQQDFNVRDYMNVTSAVNTYINQLRLPEYIAKLETLPAETFYPLLQSIYDKILGSPDLWDSGLEPEVIQGIYDWFNAKRATLAPKETP